MTCSPAGSIELSGARTAVIATGVGAPSSLITVTIASPVPSAGMTSSRSCSEVGKVLAVALSAFASSGVKARSACWTRLPSWARTSPGMSFGVWVMKKMPTPLERIRRTVWTTWSRNALEASLNSRCASSKKNTSFGTSASPTSGSSWYSSASIHIMKVENSAGREATPGSSRQEIMPAPSFVRSSCWVSKAGSPKKTSAPEASKAVRLRRITPAVALEIPPMPLSSSLPSSEVRNWISARRSLRSSSARPWESA